LLYFGRTSAREKEEKMKIKKKEELAPVEAFDFNFLYNYAF
jgi:hypothetical protein